VKLPSPDEAGRLTGSEIVSVLRQAVANEVEACALLADAAAARSERSGFLMCSEIAQSIAAQIRARKAQ